MRRNFAVTTGGATEEARPAKRARRAGLSALLPPLRYVPRPIDGDVITALDAGRDKLLCRNWKALVREAAEEGQDINDRRLVLSCPSLCELGFLGWTLEARTLAPEDRPLLSLLDLFLLHERDEGMWLPAEVQVGHAALSPLLPEDLAKIVASYLPTPAYYQPLPKGTLMSLPGRYRAALYDILFESRDRLKLNRFHDWQTWYASSSELGSDPTIIQVATGRPWISHQFPGVDHAYGMAMENFLLYRRYERLFWSSVEDCLNSRMQRVFMQLADALY